MVRPSQWTAENSARLKLLNLRPILLVGRVRKPPMATARAGSSIALIAVQHSEAGRSVSVHTLTLRLEKGLRVYIDGQRYG